MLSPDPVAVIYPCGTGATIEIPFCFFLAVISSAGVLPPAADRPAEELDIREATFRYQFARSTFPPKPASYCLTIMVNGMETDPDDMFLARFAANKPPVKKVSDCTRTGAKGVGVIDKKTGESGVIFRTEAIRWISDSEAEVEGGDYAGGLAASGNTYYLRKIQDKWQVQRFILRWIA